MNRESRADTRRRSRGKSAVSSIDVLRVGGGHYSRFVQISRKEHHEVYLREPSGYTTVDGGSPHRNFAGRKVVHRGVYAERAGFYRLAEHRRGRAQ